MKTFKQFLEEASNAVQTFRDKGFRIRNLFGPGGKYKKLEPIPKPNTQAMGKGGSPGQPYDPPKEDPKNPYVPAPKRIRV